MNRRTLEGIEPADLPAVIGHRLAELEDGSATLDAAVAVLRRMISEQVLRPAQRRAVICGYQDCGTGYLPLSTENLAGMAWTCLGCGRLTRERRYWVPGEAKND